MWMMEPECISIDIENEIDQMFLKSQKPKMVFLTFLHHFACRVF